ncbi:MAG: type II toxin-antitoxin system RelE/ParE family toxin [Bacteroidota bacterium]|nr:type II toxin-antitoxin system RelE/ParE family toxin [Bacteroidota bacterium]
MYRAFCCFDKGKLIIVFNGFQKKSQKTPMKEIEKAMELKKEYFRLKKELSKRNRLNRREWREIECF